MRVFNITLKEININTLLLAAAIILLIVATCERGIKSKKLARLENMIEAAGDSLRITRNDLGQEVAETRAIVGKLGDISVLSELGDETLEKLAQLIDKSTQSATIIESETRIIERAPVTIVDTLYRDTSGQIWPIYRADYDDRWLAGTITASPDSITPELTIFNEYHLKHKYKKKKLFKPRELVVEITNLNPLTSTRGLESFTVKQRRRRFGLGFSVGVGIDLARLRPAPIVGVSLNYNLIEF